MKIDQHPFLKSMDPELASMLLAGATVREFAQDECVFDEGSPPDYVYLVLSGKVEFRKNLSDDKYQVVSTSLEGDLFGELAVLENKNRFLKSVCVEPSVLGLISGEDMTREFNRLGGGLANAIVKKIISELKFTTNHYVQEAVEKERLSLLGNMVGSIIHDFKSPFTSIRLGANLIEMNEPPEDTLEICQMIAKQIDRMTVMAEELIEYSRGQYKVDKKPFMLKPFVHGFVKLNEALIKSLGLLLEINIEDIEVIADENKILRVLQNLLGNAIEALEGRANGMIIIQAKREKDQLEISLEDNGPGIPESIRARFFEPFVTLGKRKGTGLGTAIIKSIVDAHGGKISFETATGKGTKIIVTLPQ